MLIVSYTEFVRPISGFLTLAPISDLAYSFLHGADIRKQWKDLVLAGNISGFLYKPSANNILKDHIFLLNLLVRRNANGQDVQKFLKMQ